MATITLKNLPNLLHEKLKAQALRHHRSLNSEIIAYLETNFKSQKIDPDSLLLRAQKLRSRIRGYIKNSDLVNLKKQGRP
ncbi:MAG: Arc family DNA-binding protein [Deltaproteobacteria bacterium]|nr:Arc family DNA-binding protein [Deltaproteobacteria bacterium]